MADHDVELGELRAANEALTEELGHRAKALAAIASTSDEADSVRTAVRCLIATTDGVTALRTALEDT